MLKQRRDAAMKVAESLFAAEEAIDAALARTAELNSKMVTARTDASLSALVGQDASKCRPPPSPLWPAPAATSSRPTNG